MAQEEASAQDQVLVRLFADPLARVPACRPAVREVVHQPPAQRGGPPRLRDSASAARESRLPFVRSISAWRSRAACRSRQREASVKPLARSVPVRSAPEIPHCYFSLDHLNVFLFAPEAEMPLWKRKEAKEKGLSEPDSLWS